MINSFKERNNDKGMGLVVALTGASGQIYGIRILEELKRRNIGSYVVVSKAAEITLGVETDYNIDYIRSLSSKFFANEDIAAPMSSGSFKHDGMVISPCSMKTASSIASGLADNLISRSADVTLKEGRTLLLLVRETPLHSGHLSNLLKLSNMGAIIMPPVPSFYTKPSGIDDIVNQTVARVLGRFKIDIEAPSWEGIDKS